MGLLERFERDMNLQALKYLVGKQMFCKFTDQVLDYRNAISITATKEQIVETQVIHGSLKGRMDELVSRLEKEGFTVEIFSNLKTIK